MKLLKRPPLRSINARYISKALFAYDRGFKFEAWLGGACFDAPPSSALYQYGYSAGLSKGWHGQAILGLPANLPHLLIGKLQKHVARHAALYVVADSRHSVALPRVFEPRAGQAYCLYLIKIVGHLGWPMRAYQTGFVPYRHLWRCG